MLMFPNQQLLGNHGIGLLIPGLSLACSLDIIIRSEPSDPVQWQWGCKAIRSEV